MSKGRVIIEMTDDQFEVIVEAARSLGQTRSTFIRAEALKAAEARLQAVDRMARLRDFQEREH